MDDIKICQEIKNLLEEGEYFTFENFSSERVRNLPAQLSPKWISWQNRAINLITTYLSEDSNPYILLKEGIEICLIGAKKDKFRTVKNYITQALSEALEFINHNGTKSLLTTIDSAILTANKKEIKTQSFPPTPKIVISHTLEQEKLVEALVNVFESALNVNVGDIRCTSLSGYSFPIGINVTSLLHTEIKQAEIVIGIMTLDKAQSNVLFELGAAWGFQKSIFLVLADEVTTNYFPSPLQELNSIILTDTRKCHELVDRLVEETTLEKKENVNAIIAGAIQKLAEVSREQHNTELQRKDDQKYLNYLQSTDMTTVEKDSRIRSLENFVKMILTKPSFYVKNYQNQGDMNMSGDRHIQAGRDYRETHINDQGTNVEGDYYNNLEKKQNLAEVAAEIQQLLEQLEKVYPTNTTTGKMALATEAIVQIDSNTSLTARILSALETGSIKAFEQFLSHPAASFLIGALEDWEKTKKIN